MDILIIVDNKLRDAVSCMLVAKELERRGIKAGFANKINFFYLWNLYKPKVVVVPHTRSWLKPLCKVIATKSHLVVMPQEGAVPQKDARFISIYAEDLSMVKKVLLWGEQSAEWLLEENIFREDQLAVTGTARFDPYWSKYSKEKPEKFTLGMATGFNLLNTYAGFNMFRLIERKRDRTQDGYFSSDRNMEDFIWYCAASCRTFIDLLELSHKKGMNINIRPSLFENINNYDYFKNIYPDIKVQSAEPLSQWLSGVSCVTTYSSTSGIEAIMMGRPVIYWLDMIDRLRDHVKMDSFTNPYFKKFYWRPESKDEYMALLEKAEKGELGLTPEPEAFDKFIKDIYSLPHEKPSAVRIADEIMPVFDEKVEDNQEFHTVKKFVPEGDKKYSFSGRAVTLAKLSITTFRFYMNNIRKRNLKHAMRYNYTHFEPALKKLTDEIDNRNQKELSIKNG